MTCISIHDTAPMYRCSAEQQPANAKLLLSLTAFCLSIRDETVPQTVSLLEGAFSRGAAATGLWFDTTVLVRCTLPPLCLSLPSPLLMPQLSIAAKSPTV